MWRSLPQGIKTAKTSKYELCIDWVIEGFKALIVTVGLFSYCKLASYVLFESSVIIPGGCNQPPIIALYISIWKSSCMHDLMIR